MSDLLFALGRHHLLGVDGLSYRTPPFHRRCNRRVWLDPRLLAATCTRARSPSSTAISRWVPAAACRSSPFLRLLAAAIAAAPTCTAFDPRPALHVQSPNVLVDESWRIKASQGLYEIWK